jgi:uncharacterized tellurite resistance protein B-like protein
MLDAIKQFIADLTGMPEPRQFGDDDYRLAAAALLVHAIAIDGNVSSEERTKLHQLLRDRFGLDDADADRLAAAAEAADNEAVDLYGFTSILMRRLDAAGRERIVEMMWELVFVDGTVHEFEENLIWRVAELLGISTQTRIRLKQAVRDGVAS